jgi:hypothetical protein
MGPSQAIAGLVLKQNGDFLHAAFDIVLRVDFAKLRAQAQAAAEQIWDTRGEWDPLGRTHEPACPWSYPIAE